MHLLARYMWCSPDTCGVGQIHVVFRVRLHHFAQSGTFRGLHRGAANSQANHSDKTCHFNYWAQQQRVKTLLLLPPPPPPPAPSPSSPHRRTHTDNPARGSFSLNVLHVFEPRRFGYERDTLKHSWITGLPVTIRTRSSVTNLGLEHGTPKRTDLAEKGHRFRRRTTTLIQTSSRETASVLWGEHEPHRQNTQFVRQCWHAKNHHHPRKSRGRHTRGARSVSLYASPRCPCGATGPSLPLPSRKAYLPRSPGTVCGTSAADKGGRETRRQETGGGGRGVEGKASEIFGV